VSRATIRAVEKELTERAEAVASVQSGGYIKISAEERVKIGGYAARNGGTATLRHLKQMKEYPNIIEATVHSWKNEHCEEPGKR